MNEAEAWVVTGGDQRIGVAKLLKKKHHQHLQTGLQWNTLHYLWISIGHCFEGLGTLKFSMPMPVEDVSEVYFENEEGQLCGRSFESLFSLALPSIKTYLSNHQA